MILLNIPPTALSSSIPAKFSISEVEEKVLCAIILNQTRIYETTLYAKEGYATFYDLKDIVEDYMRSQHIAVASLCIHVEYDDEPSSEEEKDDMVIVYSAIHHNMGSDADFLHSHFLTTRHSIAVPRGYECNLSLFAVPDEQPNLRISCRFLLDGEIIAFDYQGEIYVPTTPNCIGIPMESASLTALCEAQKGEVLGRLLSATAVCGQRNMSVYYTDDIPTVSFFFYNAFNVPDFVHIIGKATTKTDISRKEAKCQGVVSFYDETVEQKQHIETCHFALNEARWFNEFLTSPFILCHVPPSNDLEVLISDVTSEIVDAPDEQTRFKFAWRLTDNARWLLVTQQTQIFTDNFDTTFQ